ncbi:LAME_0F11188g1_1 [Lachancea meyersii CBS 8951]|uniref:LAME_0F11188g1_1 n=1 Tax=Lachancea meyersii CBS 8951 TaxID=1266667 RepID=A0A1G4JVY2_9SACH|nr:LAME_0F11188g1_1 [Lachancea meyersii CBS 8951]
MDNAHNQLPSSPLAPAMSPPKRALDSSPFLENDASVADRLQRDRQRQYESSRQPLSSPLKDTGSRFKSPSRRRRRSLQLHRHQALEKRVLQARGGSMRMELDVMALERDAEQCQLATQAQWHQVDPNYIEKYEFSDSERANDGDNDDNDEDDEDELIALLQEQEDYEAEFRLEQELLEYAMAQFSLEEDKDRDPRLST